MSSHVSRLASRYLALALALAALAGLTPPASMAFTQNPATVFVNEIHYDNSGTDAGEFVEIAGPAGTDLTGWTLVLYNGATPSAATVYDTEALPSPIPDLGGGFGVVTISYPANGIQNGSNDGLALVDASSQVVQFLSYEGTITASSGPAAGLTSTDIGASESDATAPGLSLQLTGSGTTYQSFVWAPPADDTPGTLNQGQSFGASLPTVTISATDGAAAEAGSDPGTFRISRTGDTTDALTVNVSVGGTASAADYAPALSATVEVDAGAAFADVTITPADDADAEGGETVALTVTAGAGYSVGSPASATVTIADDDGPAGPCQETFTPIYSIQGSGTSAAITGSVTTQGVVVGDFETGSGLQGFYLQDAAGDGSATTSDGIFVYTGNNASAVSPGDLVRVTGFARERFQQTTLNGADDNSAAVSPGNIVVCGAASAPAPVAVTFPVASPTFLERYEGMLVTLPQVLTISEYFDFDRFGEIVLSYPDGVPGLGGRNRFYTPTSIVEPGDAALALSAEYELRQITIDDGRRTQNPSPPTHPNGQPFSLTNRFRGGDTVQGITGVLGYDFDVYRIQPTAYGVYTPLNPRPAAPEPVGGSLRVSALNTLNFFLTADNIQEGSNDPDNPDDNLCGPVGNKQECRGWDGNQPDEFARQRAKLLEALKGIDADVLGLIELENTTGVDPLGDPASGIVPGLNAALGADTYAYLDTGTIGTDAIKVGIIYQPAVVEPVGPFQILDSTDDSRFRDTRNRPVLAQTFREKATGELFTVAVAHLKSKGSDCDAVGDPDANDGQGNCNVTRTLAAEALVDWLDATFDDPDFLIVGDLNAYAKEDPVDAILAGPDDATDTADDYTSLIQRFVGPDAYSYVFDGQIGYLDHALASASMLPQVTGATEWHINADEPDILDYDTSFKQPAEEALYEINPFRTSDHDPLIVGLRPGVRAYAYLPLVAAP